LANAEFDISRPEIFGERRRESPDPTTKVAEPIARRAASAPALDEASPKPCHGNLVGAVSELGRKKRAPHDVVRLAPEPARPLQANGIPVEAGDISSENLDSGREGEAEAAREAQRAESEQVSGSVEWPHEAAVHNCHPRREPLEVTAPAESDDQIAGFRVLREHVVVVRLDRFAADDDGSCKASHLGSGLDKKDAKPLVLECVGRGESRHPAAEDDRVYVANHTENTPTAWFLCDRSSIAGTGPERYSTRAMPAT
jgi:hypothetical protein